MPTYAVLGATGQIGSSIYTILARDPSNIIHVYVRSEKRLASIVPDALMNPNVKIFEGQVDDVAKLAACLAHPVTAVFSCLAASKSVPGTNIALDTAHSTIAALISLRLNNHSVKLPKVLVISSSSVNEHLSRNISPLIHNLVLRCFSYVYDDLRRAEAYYRLHHQWMTVIFVQPSGLSHDVEAGFRLTTDAAFLDFISFLDLAAGFVQIAKDSEGDAGKIYDWKGVAVLPIGKGAKNGAPPWAVLTGLLYHYFPMTYTIQQWAGLA